MIVPDNIHTVGLYDAGEKAEQTSAMLLSGHVSGPTQSGVFRRIDKLSYGDMITVQNSDGSNHKYKVVSSVSYPKDEVDMKKAVKSITPGKYGLNLITCATAQIPGQPYRVDRLVVFAEAM